LHSSRLSTLKEAAAPENDYLPILRLWRDFLRRRRRFAKIDQWKHTIIDRKHKEAHERECDG